MGRASPFLASDDLASKVPKAWIGVAGSDILRDEGIQYEAKLSKIGIEIEIQSEIGNCCILNLIKLNFIC